MSEDLHGARRRALTGLLLFVSLALVAWGGWLVLSERGVVGGEGTTPSGSPAGVASADPTGASDDGPSGLPEAAPASYRPGAPLRVVIPALAVDAPVLPVGAPGSVLVPPSDPTTLGWWAGGAEPGAARGSALIAGHTVSSGGGALDDLETLQRGDRVVVRTRRDRISYRVASVRIYDKDTIAARAERFFDQEVAGRLVLLTCEGWDGERYHSNVVVTADPIA